MANPTRNTQADREFLKEHGDEMRVVDTQLVWNGTSEDIGNPWTLPPAEHRCRKTQKIRDDNGGEILGADRKPLVRRCEKWAMRRNLGATLGLCVEHAGQDGEVRKAIQEQAMGMASAILGEMGAIALDPTTDIKERLKAMNSILDRAGIRGGIEVSPDMAGWQQVLKDLAMDRGESAGES